MCFVFPCILSRLGTQKRTMGTTVACSFSFACFRQQCYFWWEVSWGLLPVTSMTQVTSPSPPCLTCATTFPPRMVYLNRGNDQPNTRHFSGLSETTFSSILPDCENVVLGQLKGHWPGKRTWAEDSECGLTNITLNKCLCNLDVTQHRASEVQRQCLFRNKVYQFF